MGQYYNASSLGKSKKSVKSWLYSHDYNNGLKLMEHSYLTNAFMNAVEGLLMPNGAWYKTPIVWAGDYADECKGRKTNVYKRCTDKNKINPESKNIPAKFKFIVNHSKKMFVDKTKVPVTGTYNKIKFRIHPLSLLTAEGCGQGGGDFFGEDKNNLVGSWARNIISIESEVPTGYKELLFDLVEGR